LKTLHFENDKKFEILSQKKCFKRCETIRGRYKTINSLDFDRLKQTNDTIQFIRISDRSNDQKCFKRCGSDCLQYYWEYDILNTVQMGPQSDYAFEFKFTPQIQYIHRPKTQLIDLICQIAGIFNLWFGIAVINLDFIANYSIKFVRNHNFLLVVKKYFRLIFIMTCYSFCFYHLSNVFRDYFSFPTNTIIDLEKSNVNTAIAIC